MDNYELSPLLEPATKPITVKTRVPSEDLPSFYHETGRIFVLDGLTWEGATQEMTLRFVPPPTMEEKWNDPKKCLPGVGVAVRWKMQEVDWSKPWSGVGYIDNCGGITFKEPRDGVRCIVGSARGWLPL